MADSVQAAARTEIVAHIAGLLASTDALFNAEKAQRINWRFLMERGEQGLPNGLVPPWHVVQFQPAIASARWGMKGDCYEQDVVLWRVTSLIDQEGGAYATGVLNKSLEDWMNDARRSIRAATFPHCWVLDEGQILNASETNEANAFFLRSNMSLKAAELRFRIAFGEQ
jgi:hypothetical protein